MATLYKEEGANLRVEVLKKEAVLDFIGTHADILDSTFSHTKMSDTLRQSLQRSNWIFSGMKTFHELHEAFPSLLDEEGKRKPFERFLKDVQRVDETYNRNYLRAEYNFATASAQAAAQWERIEADADRYHLQYRTAGDDRVRDEHQKLEGITLPPSDSFWDTYYPPNGWNCRCRAVQVRNSKYPSTPSHEVIQRVTAHEAQQKGNKRDMFRFNSGKQKKVWPDYNPYTIRNCSSCPLAQGKMNLVNIPQNEMCQGCAVLKNCVTRIGCNLDSKYGNRLLIHKMADKSEIEANIRIAHILLENFPNMHMTIRGHVLINKEKNPEYTIDGQIADRKGIRGTNGVTSGFKKAIKQGCSVVVIDLNEHLEEKRLQTKNLAKELSNRFRDFHDKIISTCYVVYRKKAVMLTIEDMPTDPRLTKGEDKGVRTSYIEALLTTIATP